MSAPRIYLDHNASSPLRPQARAAFLTALDVAGNASSVHAEGRRARAVIETAREQVASLVGARPRQIVFTSGGTEANNAVVVGGWDTIVRAGIEHDSVLAPSAASGARVIALPVLASGRADLTGLDGLLEQEARDRRRVLVCLQFANNETGAVQPVAEAAAIARRHGACLHTDAVQAVAKIPLDFQSLGADVMTLSAHKIGGPKGVGALVVGDGVDLSALLTGGGQERGSRAGTENVAGIAAFGAAAACTGDLDALTARILGYRERIEQHAAGLPARCMIASSDVARLPNTSCIAVPGMSSETLVIALDLAGIAVSAGAACSSGKVKASHVLTAMGWPAEMAGSAIRVSTGWNTTPDDIDAFLDAFEKVTNINRATRLVA